MKSFTTQTPMYSTTGKPTSNSGIVSRDYEAIKKKKTMRGLLWQLLAQLCEFLR
jgi:hypothetical protein